MVVCVCMYICMKYVNSNDLLEHVPEIILFFKAANVWNMFIAIACKVMLGAGASGQGSEGNGYGYVLLLQQWHSLLSASDKNALK